MPRRKVGPGPGAAKPPGQSPGSAGGILGARGACFSGAGWGSAEDLFPLRLKGSVCDSVSRSELQESGGAGRFSALPPTLGIPRLRAQGAFRRPGAWEVVGAGREPLTRSRGSWAPNLHWPGLYVGQLRWAPSAHPARQVTSSGLAGCGRELMIHFGLGGDQGPVWGACPAPG